MPACHASIVIDQGIQLINLTLGAFLVGDIICQIQVMNGEIDEGFQLVLCRTAKGEPLKMNNQNLRKPPQVQLLAGLPLLLASRTVP